MSPMSTLVQIRSRNAQSPVAIQLTRRARTELGRLGVSGGKFMRIGVVSGGCAGLTYAATLDEEISDADVVLYDDDGVRIIAGVDDAAKLGGLQIDYSDDLVSPGFRLTNSNATRACGCGSSFSV